MAKRRIVKASTSSTLAEVFPRFVTAQAAKGVTDKTIATYHSHLHCISNHLDLNITFDDLTKEDLEEMIVSMRESGLAYNSIASYTRVLRTFLNWCNREGLTTVKLPNLKDKETVKDTYSDEELALLLKKPTADSNFCEYRNWVIINFFMNCGCRAATVRNIQNRDVDLIDKRVTFRHTKTGKIQVIPLCKIMVSVLQEYMNTRGGEPEDYLFCNEYGEFLTESALRSAIYRYNLSRGVQKTSIHLFRHTFARKYLVDCGGDAFTLQTLLGHKTLKMTKHYCAIFDSDISNNFDSVSPLAQINKPRQKLSRR